MGNVHVAVGRNQQPMFGVALADDAGVFNALLHSVSSITEMISKAFNSGKTSLPQAFSMRLGEGILKK
jgi:hypothetical protein